MNVTNTSHDPETGFKTEISDTTNHISTVDENLERAQDDQAGNTATHGYNLRPRPTK